MDAKQLQLWSFAMGIAGAACFFTSTVLASKANDELNGIVDEFVSDVKEMLKTSKESE